MEQKNIAVERLVMKNHKSQSKEIHDHNRLIFITPKQKKQIEFYRKNKLKMKLYLDSKKN